jgi:hypothetical protein
MREGGPDAGYHRPSVAGEGGPQPREAFDPPCPAKAMIPAAHEARGARGAPTPQKMLRSQGSDAPLAHPHGREGQP